MSTAWLKPAVQTLTDQVAKAILSRIATGELRPGDKLPSQRELSTTLGVGMSAIREAVQRLQALNVIEAEHGTGMRVRPFRWIPLIYDPSLFLMATQHIGTQDLWEARQVIETQIVKLAIARATPGNLASIHAVLEQAGPAPQDFAASQALNRQFHMAVAHAAQNMVLEDLLDPLLSVQIHVAQYFNDARSRRTWAIHREIFDVLAARNVAGADDVMRRHFEFKPAVLEEIEKASQIRWRKARRSANGRIGSSMEE